MLSKQLWDFFVFSCNSIKGETTFSLNSWLWLKYGNVNWPLRFPPLVCTCACPRACTSRRRATIWGSVCCSVFVLFWCWDAEAKELTLNLRLKVAAAVSWIWLDGEDKEARFGFFSSKWILTSYFRLSFFFCPGQLDSLLTLPTKWSTVPAFSFFQNCIQSPWWSKSCMWHYLCVTVSIFLAGAACSWLSELSRETS